MGFLIKCWFYAAVFSLTIYTPLYFFANDDIDAIQELTIEDLMSLTGPTNRNHESFAKRLENVGVDVSDEIIDALDDNEHFSDVSVEYVQDGNIKDITPPFKVVAITAKLDKDIDFRLSFAVLPKNFSKNWSKVAGIVSFDLSRNGTGVNLLNLSSGDNYSPENEYAIFGLLSSDESVNNEMVREIIRQLPTDRKPSSETVIGSQQNMTKGDLNKSINDYLNQPPVEPDAAAADPVATQTIEQVTLPTEQAEAQPTEHVTPPSAQAVAQAAEQEVPKEIVKEAPVRLPFVGKRMFDFDREKGTEQSVTIYEDGRTVIQGCGTTFAILGDPDRSCVVHYDGMFLRVLKTQSHLYRVTYDSIAKVDAEGYLLKDCNQRGENCQTSLYEKRESPAQLREKRRKAAEERAAQKKAAEQEAAKKTAST